MLLRDEMSLSRQMYLEWKRGAGARGSAGARPERPERKGADRDPLSIKNVVSSLLTEYGWDKEMQLNALVEEWSKIVGLEIAERTEIISVQKGVINIECSSTPWSVQLRSMKLDILEKIHTLYPRSEVTDIKFTVPGLPTWKHGVRSVPGRGPRDTYK